MKRIHEQGWWTCLVLAAVSITGSRWVTGQCHEVRGRAGMANMIETRKSPCAPVHLPFQASAIPVHSRMGGSASPKMTQRRLGFRKPVPMHMPKLLAVHFAAVNPK